MIVVDASLATKWVVPEVDSPAALDFLSDNLGEMVAPDLLLIEVAGVLVRAANQRSASKPVAMRALARWTRAPRLYGIGLERCGPERIDRAARIAIELGHPLKDCVYLALAVELDCLLATCDVRFRNKASAFYPRVHLLADLIEGSPPPG